MDRIFGFDIGTTSVGFAVIDYDRQAGAGTIHSLGVRIFPEARDPDGTPLNQQRRQKRMIRRQLRRRRVRRRFLNETLAEAGLLPEFDKAKESDWDRCMRADPYELRKRGLNEALSRYELGRALYHLAQRRHFKGRELEQPEEDIENGEDADAADETAAKNDASSVHYFLKQQGTTLGVWLASKDARALKGNPPTERRRGVHATREDVTDEFEKLWAAQAEHHEVLRDTAFKAKVQDVIFAQRPVFWRKNTLGECPFMPSEPLCPKGSWLSRQRRMLEKLNNLALAGGNARPLDDEERAAILAALRTQGSMTWGGVRRALGALYKARGEPGLQKSFKFNLELGGDKQLPGNPVEAKLATIFGDGWHEYPHKQAIRDALHERLWKADYGEIGDQRVVILPPSERAQRREAAARSFADEFGATPEQAVALRDMTFPTGWEPYSVAALRAILPKLEDGVRFGALTNGPEWEAWRQKTFPNRAQPTGEVLDRLPSPAAKEEQERIRKLRNPTVVRTQNELRKVVNNLIDVYGKPDLIRIELAREVGRSKREREEMQRGIRRQERRRKEAIKDLGFKGIPEPSRDDVEKWMLWKEGQERCPYTGDQISFDALFREGRYEVEHIWPRSRSFDDGFRNKTLCRKDINIEKGNRTPYEYLGHDPDRWAAIQTRLNGMVAQKGGAGMPQGKVKRFLAEAMPEGFVDRQLNDTGYAARQAVTFLKRLWPDVGVDAPVTVQAVSGRVTAQLRRLWGLNNVLADDGEKTRADHRHHAIDALTVACTHPGVTNQLSRYWQMRDDPRAERPDLPPPWPMIRAEAERAVLQIVVSHRVRKKVSGPLHEEMPFGYTGKDVEKGSDKSLGIYVKRIPVEKLGLETLKITSVEQISRKAKFVVRDGGIRKCLLAHMEAADGKSDKAYPPYPRLNPDGPEIRKVRVLTTQQKELMVPVLNGHADPSNNHHISIYRFPNGRTKYEVVSLFEAARRLSTHQPVVRRGHDGQGSFLMSLSPGDALEFPEGQKKGIWIVQGAWANGQVVLERDNDAAHSTTTRPSPATLAKEGARKVSIDPIGRIRPAND